MAHRKFDRDLAAWMRRASIPDYAIAASFGVKPQAIVTGLKGEASARRSEINRRAALAVAERQLAWCPPEHRITYRTLMRKVGAAEARRLIERDYLGRGA